MLRVIKAAQRLGFTLDEVAELLETARHRHGGRVTGLAGPRGGEAGRGGGERIDCPPVIRDTLRAALDAGCDDLMTVRGVGMLSAAVRRVGRCHGTTTVTNRSGRRSRMWILPAGLAGVACAACCAVPLLVAAGLLGGAGAVGALLRWLPTTAVALVVVAAVVFLLPWRRNPARGCAGGTGCACITDAGDSSGKRSTLAP